MKYLVALFVFAVYCEAIDFQVSCGQTCPDSYTIDGEADPALTLFRGFSYTFQVDAQGHPFYIKTVSGSSGSTNDVYSDGVTGAGATDGNVVFEVPNDAPDTLYYQCSAHSAMTGPLHIVTANETYSVSCSGGSCPTDYNVDGNQDPALLLMRGGNYAFEVDAAGHPFYIKTESGSLGTTDSYNEGVVNPGAETDTVTFSVPNDAPDTLYYQCGNHAQMHGALWIRDDASVFQVSCAGGSCPISYNIDGEEDPELTLERGKGYTFVVDAPGHPFYIKTVSGSTGSTADVYSEGVTGAGTANGMVNFVVPQDAPSVLYYQCSAHADMTGKINIPGGTSDTQDTNGTEDTNSDSEETSKSSMDVESDSLASKTGFVSVVLSLGMVLVALF